MSATLDLSKVDGILLKYGNEDGALIPVLQSAQEAYGICRKRSCAGSAGG